MLSSGAETYRVEDTMYHILNTSNAEMIEALALMTGIVVTVNADDMQQPITMMKTVNRRSTNLHNVIQVNDISRKYCSGELTLEEAYEKIKNVREKQYSRTIYNLATAGVATGFAMMLGGSVLDVLGATIVGLILASVVTVGKITKMNSIIADILAGISIAAATLVLKDWCFASLDMDIVIVSAIMPIVPGVAITNAIRDTLHGDYLSGCARILEAFLKAASLAVGVGVGIAIYSSIIGGGVL